MTEKYEPSLKAHVVRDPLGRARAVRHSQEFWEAESASTLEAATEYLRQHLGVFEMNSSQLDSLHIPVEYLNPTDAPPEYRLSDENSGFDSVTYGFNQTVHNIPVWHAGVKVTLKRGPNRVVRSVDTSHDDVEVTMPTDREFARYRSIFEKAEQLTTRRLAGESIRPASEADLVKLVTDTVGVAPSVAKKAVATQATRLIRGRFYIYRYDANKRFEGNRKVDHVNRLRESDDAEVDGPDLDPHDHPMLDLPDVPDSIVDGRHYVCAEITFELPDQGDGYHFPWKALVELTTGSVLYLRALTSNVDGLVFTQDPPTKTGDTSLDSADSNAILNPHRDSVLLSNLGAPSGGQQALTGTWATVGQIEGADIAAPTKATGVDFDYDTRTNDFAAVSGYFHVDRIFREIASLGFDVSTYFSNTNFPITVDIRCFDVVNAHCPGNGMGGIGHVGFGLMDTTDTTNPLGRACDPRVHWHEVCGHGILYQFVDGPNFDFSHSAGDALSGIYFDPESSLNGVDGTPLGKPGDLRFTYVPWHPSLNRRFDRDVSSGWAWGGSHDNGGYGSEEILATTLFNVYRSIGGDSTSLGRRRFASRMAMYLILRSVQNLTPATNPNYARDFAGELMAADLLNWTSEGVDGGAYNKVIRWAFERQGDYQVPLVTSGGPGDGSVTAAGKPPEQDVYIDDGRAGGYEFQHVHWHTTTIWNRRTDDAMVGHQEPALGETNYAYVKVKNRGTQTANNVVVKGFHTKPGAGLLWPNDFEAFTTPSIAVGSVGGNDSDEQIVGPFEWTPNINAYGHDCMLMVVSADGDASNVDNFTAGEVIPEWRLVPNDNNVGQRNVHPVPGGGGMEGLMAGLNGVSMWIGNPNPRRAVMTVATTLPAVLVDKGWKLTLDGFDRHGDVVMKPGERREVKLRLQAGSDFTRAEIEALADRDIAVDVFADDGLIGGMAYHVDPMISRPYNTPDKDGDCGDAAKAMLDCLGVRNQDVCSTQIKEVIVGFKMDKKDCC